MTTRKFFSNVQKLFKISPNSLKTRTYSSAGGLGGNRNTTILNDQRRRIFNFRPYSEILTTRYLAYAKLHVSSPYRSEISGWTSAQVVASSVTMTDDVMVVQIDVSGFKRDNITVKVEGNWLMIDAFSSVVEGDSSFNQRQVTRRFELPDDADIANIKSKYHTEKKTLTVTIPRGVKKIEIT